jgi:HAD superfamily hydrolase (TIGR01509 family)
MNQIHKHIPAVIKALLIDFDGTLVDSMIPLRGCYEDFLRHYGAVPSRQEFDSLIGPGLTEIVGILKSAHHLEKSKEELQRNYRSRIAEAYTKEVDFFPDALSVLSKAKSKGIKLAIVTSASLGLLEPFLTNKTPQNFFDLLITHSDGYLSKPSPEPFKEALKALGVDSAEAVAIEDSPNGIRGALAANLPTVQFGGEAVIVAQATCVAANWMEVERILRL